MLNPAAHLTASEVLPGIIEAIYLKNLSELNEVQLALYEGDKIMWFSTLSINPN